MVFGEDLVLESEGAEGVDIFDAHPLNPVPSPMAAHTTMAETPRTTEA